MTAIEAIGIVVPVNNEEQRLGAALDAIHGAIRRVAHRVARVHTVVVLDSCTDASLDVVAQRPWTRPIVITERNVGAARAEGFAVVLAREEEAARSSLWLATTDADSTVPADWLAVQLDHAEDGANAVVGTVMVTDWSGHAPVVATRYRANYDAVAGHAHVHGANLGIDAVSYVSVGGMTPRASGEDQALVESLLGRKIVRTAAIPVITSARLDARAPAGFGALLQTLAYESPA